MDTNITYCTIQASVYKLQIITSHACYYIKETNATPPFNVIFVEQSSSYLVENHLPRRSGGRGAVSEGGDGAASCRRSEQVGRAESCTKLLPKCPSTHPVNTTTTTPVTRQLKKCTAVTQSNFVLDFTSLNLMPPSHFISTLSYYSLYTFVPLHISSIPHHFHLHPHLLVSPLHPPISLSRPTPPRCLSHYHKHSFPSIPQLDPLPHLPSLPSPPYL